MEAPPASSPARCCPAGAIAAQALSAYSSPAASAA